MTSDINSQINDLAVEAAARLDRILLCLGEADSQTVYKEISPKGVLNPLVSARRVEVPKSWKRLETFHKSGELLVRVGKLRAARGSSADSGPS